MRKLSRYTIDENSLPRDKSFLRKSFLVLPRCSTLRRVHVTTFRPVYFSIIPPGAMKS